MSVGEDSHVSGGVGVAAACVCGSLDLLALKVCMSCVFDATGNAAAWLGGLGIVLCTGTGVEEEL